MRSVTFTCRAGSPSRATHNANSERITIIPAGARDRHLGGGSNPTNSGSALDRSCTSGIGSIPAQSSSGTGKPSAVQTHGNQTFTVGPILGVRIRTRNGCSHLPTGNRPLCRRPGGTCDEPTVLFPPDDRNRIRARAFCCGPRKYLVTRGRDQWEHAIRASSCSTTVVASVAVGIFAVVAVLWPSPGVPRRVVMRSRRQGCRTPRGWLPRRGVTRPH